MGVIYTKANKEIAVASTKSFTGQVVSLTLLALLFAQTKESSTGQIRMLSRARRYGRAIQHILDAAGSAVTRPPWQGGALGALRGTRYGLGHFLRGGAQAQGGQLPACGGGGGRDGHFIERGFPVIAGDQEPHVR